MPPVVDPAVSVLFRAAGRNGFQHRLYAADRQTVSHSAFFGLRLKTRHIQKEGHAAIRQRIRRLMRPMRLMLICHKPDTSPRVKGPDTYRSLLSGLGVEWPHQEHRHANAQRLSLSGHPHAVAHPEPAGLRMSNMLRVNFCVAALNGAIHRRGPPGFLKTDSFEIIASSRMV